MSKSEELPVFIDCYQLLNDIVKLTATMPRVFRYEIGERMTDLNLKIMANIFRVNSSYDKLPNLQDLQDNFNMLQMLFRVSVDQKVISPRQYAHYALRLERIGRQITGWKHFAEKNENKKAD